MYHIYLKIKLIEPIIVSASDKTETSLNCLDYIPGNTFLGMVAGELYKPETIEDSKILDLFHNGNVQYGNAYLSVNDKQTLPIPAVWYKEKGKNLEDKVYLYHKVKDEEWKSFAEQGIQIKQERNGYFLQNDNNTTANVYSVEKGVVLKSAYNSERRSAKSKEMYLYEYIEAGQEFIFEVKSNNEDYLNEIIRILTKDNRHIAKSKIAEFGKIKISKIGEIEEINKPSIQDNLNKYVVFAKSNLCFVNEDYGEFTWAPTAKDLGFTNAKINYQKSQIYFDKFHTRNGKRRTHDYDRLIIKKGSVFVIEKGENDVVIKIKEDLINNGVGVFLSEGYGDILINPDFLENISIEKLNDEPDTNTTSDIINNSFNNLLEKRKDDENKMNKLYKEVAEFIESNKNIYSNITKNQWGTIRSLIYQAKKTENPGNTLYDLIFNTDSGYIYSGRMGEKWVGSKRKKLKEFLEIKDDGNCIKDIDKLLLLTIEMPKR